jgi:pimeloyl-ACP methyl ester carboxylesterase
MTMKPSRNGHLPINGLSLYHEVHGELGRSKTPPLLLIPGAFMGTDSMKSWVSAFAGQRPVIVFDQQGHGRTPDTSREMSYEQFADDAAALLPGRVTPMYLRTAFRVPGSAGCSAWVPGELAARV